MGRCCLPTNFGSLVICTEPNERVMRPYRARHLLLHPLCLNHTVPTVVRVRRSITLQAKSLLRRMAAVLKPRPPPMGAIAQAIICSGGPSKDVPHSSRQPFLRPRGLGGFDLLLHELRSQAENAHPVVFTSPESTAAKTARSAIADSTNMLPRKSSIKEGDRGGSPRVVATSRPDALGRIPHPPAAPPARRASSGTRAAEKTSEDDSSAAAAPSPLRSHECLTSFERKEIISFPEVFYVGQLATRKVNASSVCGSNNHGFDDDKSDYRVVSDDQLNYRYQILAELGRGSFGQVNKALDHKTKEIVAVKIIKNKKKFHEQALIEIKVLKHLNKVTEACYQRASGGATAGLTAAPPPNTVRLLDSFIFRNHMVLVFPLLGASLYDLLKAAKFNPLPAVNVKAYVRQMAQCLANTHRERIVHCDLKPENVLLRHPQGSGSTAIRVIDFGSSCFESEKIYTYIQSRFYRAPEIILGIPYTTAIDMWSLGCMAAELGNGYPLFPGESEPEQIQCVMEYLGLPPTSLVDRGPKKRLFFESNGAPKCTPNSRGRTRRPCTKSLAAFLKAEPGSPLLSFVTACLAWEPAERMTPAEALRHPYLDETPVAQHHHHHHSTLASPRGPPTTASYELDLLLPRLQPLGALTRKRAEPS